MFRQNISLRTAVKVEKSQGFGGSGLCIVYINDKQQQKVDTSTATSESIRNTDLIHLATAPTSYHSLSVDPNFFKAEKYIYWNSHFHVALKLARSYLYHIITLWNLNHRDNLGYRSNAWVRCAAGNVLGFNLNERENWMKLNCIDHGAVAMWHQMKTSPRKI